MNDEVSENGALNLANLDKAYHSFMDNMAGKHPNVTDGFNMIKIMRNALTSLGDELARINRVRLNSDVEIVARQKKWEAERERLAKAAADAIDNPQPQRFSWDD